jgi:hypothetical protein
MRSNTSRPSQELWGRLKPKYKLVAASPFIAGLATLFLSIFPLGWVLAAWLGISPDEPVIRHPHGWPFLLLLFTSLPVVTFMSILAARRVVHWWLVQFRGYSPGEVELALAWRVYPEAWLRDRA